MPPVTLSTDGASPREQPSPTRSSDISGTSYHASVDTYNVDPTSTASELHVTLSLIPAQGQPESTGAGLTSTAPADGDETLKPSYGLDGPQQPESQDPAVTTSNRQSSVAHGGQAATTRYQTTSPANSIFVQDGRTVVVQSGTLVVGTFTVPSVEALFTSTAGRLSYFLGGTGASHSGDLTVEGHAGEQSTAESITAVLTLDGSKITVAGVLGTNGAAVVYGVAPSPANTPAQSDGTITGEGTGFASTEAGHVGTTTHQITTATSSGDAAAQSRTLEQASSALVSTGSLLAPSPPASTTSMVDKLSEAGGQKADKLLLVLVLIVSTLLCVSSS